MFKLNMTLSLIDICKVPLEVLKTLGLALGFQYFQWILSNINEWKIMFDPSNDLGTSTDINIKQM